METGCEYLNYIRQFNIHSSAIDYFLSAEMDHSSLLRKFQSLTATIFTVTVSNENFGILAYMDFEQHKLVRSSTMTALLAKSHTICSCRRKDLIWGNKMFSSNKPQGTISQFQTFFWKSVIRYRNVHLLLYISRHHTLH